MIIQKQLQDQENFTISLSVHQETHRGSKRNFNMPTRRWGHTLAGYRHLLYLYGGNTSSSYLNSNEAVYKLDTRKWGSKEWSKFIPEDWEVSPEPRDSHTANIIKKNLYIIGGSKGETPTNDVLQFDLRLNKWQELQPRESHIAFSHKNRFVIIHGGILQNSSTKQDFAIIDFQEGRCMTLDESMVIGEYPPLLESHSCTKVGDEFLVYGGVEDAEKEEGQVSQTCLYRIRVYGDTLEDISLEITKVELKGKMPGLDSHCAVGVRGKWLLVFGGESLEGNCEGRNEKDFFNDKIYSLDLESYDVRLVRTEGNLALKTRSAMSCVQVNYSEKIQAFFKLEEKLKKLKEIKRGDKCDICSKSLRGEEAPQGKIHVDLITNDIISLLLKKIKRRVHYLYIFRVKFNFYSSLIKVLANHVLSQYDQIKDSKIEIETCLIEVLSSTEDEGVCEIFKIKNMKKKISQWKKRKEKESESRKSNSDSKENDPSQKEIDRASKPVKKLKVDSSPLEVNIIPREDKEKTKKLRKMIKKISVQVMNHFESKKKKFRNYLVIKSTGIKFHFDVLIKQINTKFSLKNQGPFYFYDNICRCLKLGSSCLNIIKCKDDVYFAIYFRKIGFQDHECSIQTSCDLFIFKEEDLDDYKNYTLGEIEFEQSMLKIHNLFKQISPFTNFENFYGIVKDEKFQNFDFIFQSECLLLENKKFRESKYMGDDWDDEYEDESQDSDVEEEIKIPKKKISFMVIGKMKKAEQRIFNSYETILRLCCPMISNSVEKIVKFKKFEIFPNGKFELEAEKTELKILETGAEDYFWKYFKHASTEKNFLEGITVNEIKLSIFNIKNILDNEDEKIEGMKEFFRSMGNQFNNCILLFEHYTLTSIFQTDLSFMKNWHLSKYGEIFEDEEMKFFGFVNLKKEAFLSYELEDAFQNLLQKARETSKIIQRLNDEKKNGIDILKEKKVIDLGTDEVEMQEENNIEENDDVFKVKLESDPKISVDGE